MRTSRNRRLRRERRRRFSVVILAICILLIVSSVGFSMLTKRIDSETKVHQASSHFKVKKTEVENKEQLQLKEQEVLEEEPEQEISIVFAGDTMFDWDLRPILNEKGYDYPFVHVKESVQKADYSFINLESVFTETPSFKSPDQIFWINSDVRGLQAVENAGFKMANFGNNHVLDYLEPGLLDTLENVKKTNMDYIGAGENEKEAYQSKEVIIKGKKFRFFSFVRFFPNTNWAATGDKPGVPSGYNLDVVKQTIEEQKGDADYIIVYFHWGIEKTNIPAEYQKEYVKELATLDVDLIVGSHPHWLQGFEYYDGMAVAYSLGNFLFPPYVSGRSAETGLLTATFKGDKVHMAFEPYLISKGQIIPPETTIRKEMLIYLQSISFGVEIDESGNIHQQ